MRVNVIDCSVTWCAL